jgi:DNA primase small subunit
MWSRLASKSEAFVHRKFVEYYKTASTGFPTSFAQREFGLLTFEGKKMLRHLSFRTRSDLQTFLLNTTPSDVYYSSAYYEDPEAEMDKKGWLGADLIFDIDADHIPTTCGKVHDEWICGVCGFIGKGLTPEQCPACGGQKFDVKTWPCEECLKSAKAETVKLLDMLKHDFGFSEEETHVFFSGHRGYHVHVESETVKTLDAVARKEIVDYVCGLGLETGFQNLHKKGIDKTQFPRNPRLDDFGWRGRLARGMYDFVLNGKENDYKRIGVGNDVFRVIERNKNVILRNWNDVGPYRATKDVGIETWRKIVYSQVTSSSAKIDTVVTTDIHRLIRLTSTLHGKTGLIKVEFPVSSIKTFDPFRSAVAFKKGSVTVFVSDAPEFRLGDEAFGPYKDQTVELPTAAAVLLVCKGRAEAIE